MRHLGYAIALALAGCTGWQPQAYAPATTASPGAQPSRARSWMASDAKKLDLLYVSDYQTNDVYAYSYPQGKLRGVLAGILKNFPLQAGICADRAGDVFVPDSLHSSVLEYAHGSKKLLATLLDSNEYPYSCATDPKSGALAVINLESISGPGGVAIYKRARGAPVQYSFGFIYKYYFGAYDDRGDLFVDASYDVPSEPVALLEFPRGAGGLQTVNMDQAIVLPGGVGWDGEHVDIADSKSSIIYQFDVSDGNATEVGSTQLRQSHYLAQYVLSGTSVVGANFRGHDVAFWNYPAGGAPTKKITGLGFPFGVALSKAPK